MVLNGYTILGLFFCVMQLILSVVVVSVAWSSWRLSRSTPDPDHTTAIENRSYLLFLSATVLIGVNVVSWPILYFLLQSYVKEWPSAMCIYGVTQIGAGTLGTSRFLPALVTGLQWTKPLLVFISVAGFVLYVINRKTRTSAIRNRVLVALLLTGASTFVDAVVEGAYLIIPKTEVSLTGGCCTNSLESLERDAKFIPDIRVSESQRPYVIATYYSLNGAMIVGLLAYALLATRRSSRGWQWLLLLGGVSSIPVSLLFLAEVAAPTMLGLPFHHCPYDLISSVPESMVAVGLFLVGCFSVGWAFIAGQAGRCDQTRSFLPEFVSKLLFLSLFGYAGSLAMISVEMFLANDHWMTWP